MSGSSSSGLRRTSCQLGSFSQAYSSVSVTPCSVRLDSRRGATGGCATGVSGVIAAYVSSSICFGGTRRRLFGRCSLVRLGAQELAHLRSLGIPPVGEDTHIPADAEVLYAHFEVFAGLARVAQFDARVLALLERGLDGLELGLDHLGMAVLAGLADAHGEVGGAELNHVDARHGEDAVEVVHARLLLDHDGDDDFVQRIDIVG